MSVLPRRPQPARPPESPPEGPADPVESLIAEARRERPPGPTQAPVISITRYEQISTFLFSLLAATAICCTLLTLNYLAMRPKPPEAMATLELFDELPGGSLDGSPDETLRVDSPYEERPDASLIDNPSDSPSQIEATVEGIMEFSETASNQAPQQFLFDAQTTGRKGSASGTGKRALGFGPGKRGFPRDQRWFITFSERDPIPEYARQLDYFRIELGAVFPDRIVYLTNVSGAPKTRTVNTGKDEKRLYMNWQGGTRRQADLELFKTAGIDAENALILHFYPPETERAMAKLEREFANRPADQIRRTFFVVKKTDKEYAFEVTRQTAVQ